MGEVTFGQVTATADAGDRRLVVVPLTLSSSYATGGDSVNPADVIGLRVGVIDSLQAEGSPYALQWDQANKKLKAYEGGGGGGGGGGGWSVVASGILAGATAGVIHTAVVGRSYVLAAFNADTSASNMSAGDEDLVTLPEIQNGNPTVLSAIAGSINQNDLGFEMVALGAAGGFDALAINNSGSGGGSDSMTLSYSRVTGQFTATHVQGADATNGAYVLFEKAAAGGGGGGPGTEVANGTDLSGVTVDATIWGR